MGLVDRVTRRLRDADRLARTVVLRLRFSDFTRATRSHTLVESTSHTDTILDALRALLADAGPMIAERGITLLGVALTNLDDGDVTQLELPFGRRSGNALDEVLDEVGLESAANQRTSALFAPKLTFSGASISSMAPSVVCLRKCRTIISKK